MRDLYIGSVKQRMPGNKCPNCGRTAEGGTSIDDKEAALNPKPGDFAVCLYCGALNRYGIDLRLRPIQRTERRQLQRDPRLAQLLETVSAIARAKRQQWQ